MTSCKNKIVAVIFCVAIFYFGVGTMLDSKTQFKEILSDNRNVLTSSQNIEQCIKDNFRKRNKWINVNGAFQKMIGATIVRGAGDTDVYKLKNGQVTYNLNKKDMSPLVENVNNLNKFAKENNMNLTYVQLPFKVKDDSMMPIGAKEYGNENADELLEGLNKGGIHTLDIRKSIIEDKLDYDDLFFKTDHHWKPQTALWAAEKIVDKMETSQKLNVNMNKYNLNNYDVKTYEAWFLGSLGKRTGNVYAGVDDFDVLTPKFKTDFVFWAKSAGGEIKRTGDFENVMFKKEFIDKKDYFNINTYAGYIGGDYAINTIENKLAKNDKKVLLVRDSYSCTLLPFLSLSAKQITAIDLRHYNDMSLIEYLEKNKFDTIIIAYNPSAFSDKQFDFDGTYESK